MSFAGFIDHWWNLPYLVMLGLVVVFSILQAIGLAGHGADADVDHDVDVSPDADADVDADADHDVDGDAHGGFGVHDALAYLGVGRVPFMVIWVTLFLFGGIAGIFLNSVIFTRSASTFPPWGFPVSLAGSLVIGLVAVRLFSRVAARFVDVGGKGASTKNDLAGKVGIVASTHIDSKFGEIRVRDERGNEIMVHARIGVTDAPIARGQEVILIDYDKASELFTATNADEAKANVRSMERERK